MQEPRDHEEEDNDTRMMEEDDELRRGTVVSTAIDDDILSIPSFGGISVVWKREGIMPKQAFCDDAKTNREQRALLLEFIHRIHTPDSEQIQIFFHSAARSGKTFTLRLKIEIF